MTGLASLLLKGLPAAASRLGIDRSDLRNSQHLSGSDEVFDRFLERLLVQRLARDVAQLHQPVAQSFAAKLQDLLSQRSQFVVLEFVVGGHGRSRHSAAEDRDEILRGRYAAGRADESRAVRPQIMRPRKEVASGTPVASASCAGAAAVHGVQTGRIAEAEGLTLRRSAWPPGLLGTPPRSRTKPAGFRVARPPRRRPDSSPVALAGCRSPPSHLPLR